MANPRIPIAGDHAAPALKKLLIDTLSKTMPGIEFEDLGPGNEERVDYPDYAEKVASLVSSGKSPRGILICGSGIGMAIAANKFPGVRAAVVETVEAARLSRDHNNANVLCIGARLVSPEIALSIVHTWLVTPFSEGPRHCARIDKISALEKKIGR